MQKAFGWDGAGEVTIYDITVDKVQGQRPKEIPVGAVYAGGVSSDACSAECFGCNMLIEALLVVEIVRVDKWFKGDISCAVGAILRGL
jgi:hypothetical protein